LEKFQISIFIENLERVWWAYALFAEVALLENLVGNRDLSKWTKLWPKRLQNVLKNLTKAFIGE
jgi:hypothetical protein